MFLQREGGVQSLLVLCTSALDFLSPPRFRICQHPTCHLCPLLPQRVRACAHTHFSPCTYTITCTETPHVHILTTQTLTFPTHTQMHPQHTYSPHTPLHIVYTSPAHPHLNKPTTLRSLRKVSLCCDCVALTPSAQQPQCPWTCRTVPKERSFVSRAGGKSVPYTWYLHGQRDRSPPKGCLRRCGSFSALG